MEKKTIVYVLGLGHSGSTILEYLICQSPNALGLGEVYRLSGKWAAESRTRTCTCREKVESCELWGGLKPIQRESQKDWYERLEHRVRRLFPDHDLWVDTSKSLKEFEIWQSRATQENNLEIKFIYLVRDVRSWVWSDARVRKRKQRKSRTVPVSMIFWFLQQLRFHRTISRSGISSHPIVYESLVSQPEEELARLFNFLGVQIPNFRSVDMDKVAIHDVTGNRIRLDISGTTTLRYDRNWETDLRIQSWYRWLWPVNRFMQGLYRRTLLNLTSKSKTASSGSL